MRFDFSSVDDVDSFVSVPEGLHRCRVGEVREGRARDGSVRWSFRLEVIDGDYAGRTAAWDSITWSERGVYRVKKLLEALGIDVRGEVEVQPNDLVGLSALVKVEPEEREDPLTGRRQVRMRVPYQGYAPLSSEEREALGGADAHAGNGSVGRGSSGNGAAHASAERNGDADRGGRAGRDGGSGPLSGADRDLRSGRSDDRVRPGARGLDGDDDESLAPVDGWGARRDALPRNGQETRAGEERTDGDEFGF